jgi:ubiquinone/menaquinone biosynthesis C-methylase UbiE
MANEEQNEFWNGPRGNKWALLQSTMDALIDAHGRAMLEAAHLDSGEAVLAVGCGWGATSLEAARQVGPQGHVLGLDVSAPMLARAVSRTRTEGLSQLRFERADAQTHPLGAELYDAAVSRFGVMFFDDPIAAFANIR